MQFFNLLVLDDDPRVQSIGKMLQTIHDSLENTSITQSEYDELMKDVQRERDIVEQACSLKTKLLIASTIQNLMLIVSQVKGMLP